MFGKARDPVCGMAVDKKTAATADYNGGTYYFCATSCREAFQKEPPKYAAPSAGHGGHGGHGCC